MHYFFLHIFNELVKKLKSFTRKLLYQGTVIQTTKLQVSLTRTADTASASRFAWLRFFTSGFFIESKNLSGLLTHSLHCFKYKFKYADILDFETHSVNTQNMRKQFFASARAIEESARKALFLHKFKFIWIWGFWTAFSD